MKFVIVYPRANAIFVDGNRLEFDFVIPTNLPQNLKMLHWKDPNLSGSMYRTELDNENVPLEETTENYNKWVKPFVEMWETEWAKVYPKQIQKQLTDAVQQVLDKKAQELNYDNCLSLCSYIDTGVQKFDDESRAFRKWRSAVWAKCYEILDLVKSGAMAIPSEEELISLLPELVIEYTE